MAGLTSKMIIKKMPMHANMTEMNHLGKAMIIKPYLFEGKMRELFTTQMFSDNTLTSMLSSKNEVTIPSDTWTWNLKTNTRRPLVCLGDTQSTITQPCRFNTQCELWLDENWFLAGDIIHPGEGDGKYQARIVEAPKRAGTGWIYKIQAMNDDPQFFILKRFFTTNVRWSKLFAKYEEGTQQSGSTQYSLPIELGPARVSMLRKEYSVTGDAANEVLAVSIPDGKGGMVNSWIRYAEVEYWRQWYREIEANYFYSRSTKTVVGANGRPVQSGAGLFELLEDAHNHNYSVLSGKLIQEFLMDIFYNRVKFANRKLTVFTGEYGMLAFHGAVVKELVKTGFITPIDINISKTTSPYHSNSLSFGFQYVTYKMANGAEVTVAHAPILDDREYNTEIDSITGYPVQSMRFIFMDLAGESGDNLKLVTRENSFKLGYVAGMQTPYGVRNGGDMAHSGDYYSMHVQKKCGIQIDDITRFGQLKLVRN